MSDSSSFSYSSLAEDMERFLQQSNSSIDYTDHTQESTLFNPNVTYSYDKYSCLRGAFFAHLVFNYFVFLSGIGCLITRVVPDRYKWMHRWFGRCYILSMFWSMATSLLIHNTGLPLATLLSFAAVGGGLTIGWIVIVFYQQHMDKAATERVQQQLMNTIMQQQQQPDDDDTKVETTTIDLANMMTQAKLEIRDEKTFRERFFSYKTVHAVLFFVSWFNIAGRIFASNQSGDFTCYTYPIYKPIDTAEGDYAGEDLTLVPAHDPNWDNLPWSNGVYAWSFAIIFGSMAGALLVAANVSYFGARRSKVKREAAAAASSESSSSSLAVAAKDQTPEDELSAEEDSAESPDSDNKC